MIQTCFWHVLWNSSSVYNGKLSECLAPVTGVNSLVTRWSCSGIVWLVGDNDQMHIKISSTWLCRSLLPWGYMQDGDCGRWSVIYSFLYTSNNRRRRRLTANGTLASSRPAVTGITRVCLIWHTHILLNKELGWSASLCRDERDRELMIGWALMLNMQSGRIWYRTQKIFDMNGLLLLGSY